jgi:hypothetical protein
MSIQLPLAALPKLGLGDLFIREGDDLSELYAAGPGLISLISMVFLWLVEKVTGPFTRLNSLFKNREMSLKELELSYLHRQS